MSPALLPEQEQLGADRQPQQPLARDVPSEVDTSLPREIKRRIVGGTSTLGAGMVIERGAGFLANILAARFAGAADFGAYSLAISQANNISTYAAGGIGATAARFSGKYPYGTNGYSTLARALAIISLVSAALAAAALSVGASPIAAELGKRQLTGLLRWAAISAAGTVLLECARGFFVGQHRLKALILLSVIVGSGMLTLLPAAARLHRPSQMIVLQGATTTSAVVLCLLLATRLNLTAPRTDPDSAPLFATVVGAVRPSQPLTLGPMLREVWSFGLVQLAGLIASNMAGWWLMILVARSDTTLVQMSFFAIASQLRNVAGIAPGLITEGSYAVMADPGADDTRTPHRVMALCGYGSIGLALVLASAGIIFAPWALTLLYGRSYAGAALAVTMGLAIAVVHMGNAPAAARLTSVSIRSTGVINTVWAIFVAAAATIFLLHGGLAWQAMSIYFAGHILSSILVLLTLKWKDHVPSGVAGLFVFGTLDVGALALLGWLRSTHANQALSITGLMLILLVAGITGLLWFGRRFRWLPSRDAIHLLWAGVRSRVPGRERYV